MSLELTPTRGETRELTLPTGDRFTLRLPVAQRPAGTESGDAGGGVPVAIFCHGRGSTRTQIDDAAHSPLRDELLSAGYVVVSADAGGSTWGSAEALRHMRALVAFLGREFPAAELLVMGESMGGSLASALVSHGVVAPRAVFLAAPSVSLAAAYRRAPDEYRAEYLGLFDSLPDTDSRFFARWDQARADLRHFRDVPVLIYTGTEDVIVDYAGVVLPYAERLRRAGARVTLRTTPTGHGDAQNLPPRAIRAFFDGALAERV